MIYLIGTIIIISKKEYFIKMNINSRINMKLKYYNVICFSTLLFSLVDEILYTILHTL